MTPPNQSLLNCPFCGSEASMFIDDSGKERWVSCDTCEATGPSYNPKKQNYEIDNPTEAWNTRFPQPMPEVELIEEVLRNHGGINSYKYGCKEVAEAICATFAIPSQPPQPQANPSAQKLEMVSWPEKKTNVCMCDCSGGCGCSQDDYNQAIDDCTLAREALIQEHLKEVGRLKDGLIKIRMAIHQIDGKKKSHEYIDALCKEVLGKEG